MKVFVSAKITAFITNESGLSLRLGGFRQYDGQFLDGELFGSIWTSTQGTSGFNRIITYNRVQEELRAPTVGRSYTNGYSIRCVEEE